LFILGLAFIDFPASPVSCIFGAWFARFVPVKTASVSNLELGAVDGRSRGWVNAFADIWFAVQRFLKVVWSGVMALQETFGVKEDDAHLSVFCG